MDSHLLSKLLWKNTRLRLLAGAVTGAFLGMLLLLLAVQLMADGKTLFANNKEDHYVQINKKVNVFNTLGVSSGFSDDELQQLGEQPFVEALGSFSSNDFKVGGYSKMLGFYTELFFESVPADFLDDPPASFRWSEGQRELPVLVSRDYLALYNFGFAPSQGLPQLSVKTVGRMTLEVQLTGNGRQHTLEGRVVGFTDRFNSILVPSSFLEWANQQFGSNTKKSPSRLILKVSNPMSEAFRNYMAENGYEVGTGKLLGKQYLVFFRLLIGMLALLGVVILVLATLIFLLNFQLLVAKNKASIRRLIEIGYRHEYIARFISKKFLRIFAIVTMALVVSMAVIRLLIVQKLASQGFSLPYGLHPVTWIVWIIASALLVLLNGKGIHKHVRNIAS